MEGTEGAEQWDTKMLETWKIIGSAEFISVSSLPINLHQRARPQNILCAMFVCLMFLCLDNSTTKYLPSANFCNGWPSDLRQNAQIRKIFLTAVFIILSLFPAPKGRLNSSWTGRVIFLSPITVSAENHHLTGSPLTTALQKGKH